ncbi:hypothetical protein [uncultured Cyclobacterium sp.]|uniref:hypothetical protein n=1 Tax=uncultured Cyclobacterium sp. TaxID=453820 RepID=UPI0030EDA3CE|tara:strand:+ start:55707 stop:56174 length:468 start_codon:yes stop_codon:yes gene_type:complete
MTVEEFGQYLSSQSPGLETSNGLYIHYIRGSISSEYSFEGEESDFSFCLFTEEESLHEFIDRYKIKNLSDLEELGYNHIWMRYLNGEADTEVMQMKFEEGPLRFRLHKMKTMIFSASLHFYDEVYVHLTLPEDFISYFFKNKSKISTAMANRYQF